MGLDKQHCWTAKWIEPYQQKTVDEPLFTLMDMFHKTKELKQDPVEERLHKPKYLKKMFEMKADKKLQSATLYITAHGLYQVNINGKAVTEAIFTPDYTSYDKYLQYQEYDVTSLIIKKNIWSIVLADGWYSGRISMTGGSAQFGNMLGALAEIVLEYTDGTEEKIITDKNFKSSTGKYVYSDIFIGEKQDFRLEKENWQIERTVDSWDLVEEVEYDFHNLVLQSAPQVVRKEVITAKKQWIEGDSLIVDFGQVIAGRIRMVAELGSGEEIRIEHSEILDHDGKFLTNIVGRNKEQTDIFVGDGKRREMEPDFTFHGFRYVKISGGHKAVEIESIQAIVIYSDLKKTGHLVTSNKKINQLIRNIEWSQKGNMLSIPTDCPQRERLGWTGDIQIFADTATFFMDVENFLVRWLESVKADQQENGEIPDYCPVPKDYFTTRSKERGNSSAGWGDAIIIVPWTLYERYGNKEVLESSYNAMVRWHNFGKGSAAGEKEGEERFIWDTKFHYGDWMFPSVMSEKGPFLTAKLTMAIVGTAFLAYSSELLAKVAQVLGKGEDAKLYQEYSKQVKMAFRNKFWQEDRLTADFQGCYVLAIAFNLLEEAQKSKAVDRLVALIQENGQRLDTGFVSVRYLLDVLSENNNHDLAVKLLFQEKCPSWLYEVNHGATTIWESWDAVKPDGTIGKESFNHYAIGCVGDWLVRNVGGLAVKKPGFEEFFISIKEIENITSSELSYETKYGEIKIDWAKKSEFYDVNIKVPAGTNAFFNMDNVEKLYEDELSNEFISEIFVLKNKKFISLVPGSYSFKMVCLGK